MTHFRPERRLGKSQPAALALLERGGGRFCLKISRTKPIRGYGLRQEKDHSCAATCDARRFSGLENRKNFRHCNPVTPSRREIRWDALHEGDSAPKSAKFIGNVVFWPLCRRKNSSQVRNRTRAIGLELGACTGTQGPT